jgi:hypothetical protein
VSLIAAATGPWTDGKPDMRRFRTSMRVSKGKFNNERHAGNALQGAAFAARCSIPPPWHGGRLRQAAGGRCFGLCRPLRQREALGGTKCRFVWVRCFLTQPPNSDSKLKNCTQTTKQNRRERAIGNVSLSIHLVRYHPDPQPPLPATYQLYLHSSTPTPLVWKHFCVLFMGAEAAMLPG